MGGVMLRTLRGAGEFIVSLLQKEHAAPEWQRQQRRRSS